MQFIRDIHAARRTQSRPVVSFEFFPPKTDEGDRNLLEKTLPALRLLNPDYCSVTYGAGGGTREKTLMIVDRIQQAHGLTAMCHLTCVNATREEVAGVLDQAEALGIKNILALRGDPPGGGGAFRKTEGGFEFSYQLVEFLRQRGGFCVGTAGFPEGHMACQAGKYVDWQHLKAKVDCGADFVLTQLFFDNQDFLEFRDYLSTKLGVTVPIQAFSVFGQVGRIDNRYDANNSTLKNNDATFVGLGANYSFSKRTDVCASWAKQINKGNAVNVVSDNSNAGLFTTVGTAANVLPGFDPWSFQVGIRHRF